MPANMPDASGEAAAERPATATANAPSRPWEKGHGEPTRDQIMKIYEDWAGTYDADTHRRNDPRVCGDEVVRHVPAEQRAAMRVLDCASGTGLVGEHLHALGFRNIDQLDFSPDMLAIAAKKGLFTRLIQAAMGPERLPLETDWYDLAVATGCFVPGHVKTDCLPELIRVMKPGGLIVLAARQSYLSECPQFTGMEDELAALADAGKWRQVARRVVPGSFPSERFPPEQHTGVVWVFEVL